MQVDIRLLAPIATSTGVVVSIVLWQLNQRVKQLRIVELKNESLINVQGTARKRVSVKFDEHSVDNANLVVLRLTSCGGLPVVASDFQTPLTVRLNSDARILALDVVDSDPVDLSARFKSSSGSQFVEKTSEHSLAFHPLLLNPKDYITVQMLVENYHGIANIGCHIHGVKQVQTKDKGSSIPTVLTQVGAFVMAAAMLITTPQELQAFNGERIIPFILLFLVGYVLLWAGLKLPKRPSLSVK